MKWELKQTKNKVKSGYKTLYLPEDMIARIDGIAKRNNTSWNNVVVSMIKACLDESK